MNSRMIKRHPGVIAAVAAIAAIAVQFSPVNAAAPIGPSPAPSHTVTLTASPVDSLTDGAVITYTVNTAGGTTLVGNLTAHICIAGLSGYNASNFGYSGSQAVRCVYNTGTIGVVPGIVSGGLTGGDYESTHTYGGTETTSGPLTFKAGTGSVLWGNATGAGPLNIQCDSSHPCDLVIEVNLAGDATTRTYFVQPLTYGGGGTTTTTSTTSTTTSTTSSTTTSTTSTTSTSTTSTTSTTIPATTTTTTIPATTTTTTKPVTTTTTIPATTTTTTTAPATTTTTVPGSTTTSTTVPVTTTTVGGQTTTTIPATTSTTIAATGSTATTVPPFSSTPTTSGSGGTLPFTGSGTRDLLSVALLILAAGMLLLGQYHRRRDAGHEG